MQRASRHVEIGVRRNSCRTEDSAAILPPNIRADSPLHPCQVTDRQLFSGMFPVGAGVIRRPTGRLLLVSFPGKQHEPP